MSAVAPLIEGTCFCGKLYLAVCVMWCNDCIEEYHSRREQEPGLDMLDFINEKKAALASKKEEGNTS